MDVKLENDVPTKVAGEESAQEEEISGGYALTAMEDSDGYALTVTEDSLLRLHGLSITLPLSCDLCPAGTAVFNDLDEFDVHVSEHPEAKMFSCQLCNNTYRSWSNLVAHRKMFHLGEVLSCEPCGTRKSHTRLEGAVHYPIDGKPHGCEECEVGLDTIADVNRHYVSHKTPPGGIRRRGAHYFGPRGREKWAATVDSGAQDQNSGDNPSMPQKLNGPSGLDLSENLTMNTMGTSVADMSGDLLGSLVVGTGNEFGGNLLICTSGNVDGIPGGTVVGNLIGTQNGNLLGKVVAIPSENLIGDLPGVKGGNLILKPAGVQGGIMSGNIQGIQSGSEITKSVVINDVSVNSIGIHSGSSSVKPSGLAYVDLPSILSGKAGILTGSVTVAQSHGSAIAPTGTQGGSSRNTSNKENRTPLEVQSGNMDAYLAELKVGLEKRGSKQQNGEESGGVRPIAPKDGLSNFTGQLDKTSSDAINGPGEHDEATSDLKHICPHCTFSSSKLEDYRNHLVSNARGHDCLMCSGSHFKRLSLTDHEYCQFQNRQFKCIPCTTILPSEEEFSKHLTERHTAGYLPCCLCGRKYNWLLFLEHVKLCQRKRFEWEFHRRLSCKTCQPCGKIFHSAASLRRHLRRHDTNRKPMNGCKTCGRIFQHKGAYAKHLWANPTHGPPEERARVPGTKTNYICEKCGKTFSKHEGLKGHLMRHAGVRPYACTSCPKAFITHTSLVVHTRQHTGERPYMCEVCGKNFTGPTSLYVHQRKHRAAADDGKGSGGGVGSTRKVSPIKKPATKHTCTICGKMLSSKLIFEGHMRLHTGDRPFVCDICGKGFATAKIKKLHERRHEREKVVRKSKVWVHDAPSEACKETVDMEGGFDSISSSTCIFLCPRCGLGLVSPDELEEHLSKGECPSGGAEMFVLPTTMESECIDMGSMVDVD